MKQQLLDSDPGSTMGNTLGFGVLGFVLGFAVSSCLQWCRSSDVRRRRFSDVRPSDVESLTCGPRPHASWTRMRQYDPPPPPTARQSAPVAAAALADEAKAKGNAAFSAGRSSDVESLACGPRPHASWTRTRQYDPPPPPTARQSAPVATAALADEAKAKGNAAFSAGRFKEAVQHFSDAIALAPDKHLLYSNRSAAHASLGRYAEALADAERTVALRPDWAKGYSRLGAARLGLGDAPGAAEAYEQGLAVDPSNEPLKSGLAQARQAASAAPRSPVGSGSGADAVGQMFQGPELWSKVAADPTTRGYLSQPDFVQMLQEVQRNPSSLNSYFSDQRMVQVSTLMRGIKFQNQAAKAAAAPRGGGSFPELTSPAVVAPGGRISVVGFGSLLSERQRAAGSDTGHQETSSGSGVPANRVVASQYQYKTEDIDESSAEILRDSSSYARANKMLIQVPILGTTKKFWRLSDKATRISRKLALILRSQHSVGKYLTAPLQVSHVWIGDNGSVKLRGVSFTGKGFSTERVRDDYKHLFKVLIMLIQLPAGHDITKLPPDYVEFLTLLKRDTLAMKDEFLIVNNVALLPMKNRTEVFLMLHDKIVKSLGRTNTEKKKRILSSLPYQNDWLDTAMANTKINQWVEGVQNEYKRTPLDLLRLNRNVRSHLHQYNNDDNIEETLYCEWPKLLMVMEKMLHLEGELEGTDIQNKFG